MTTFTKIDDSLYANITDFISDESKNYGDELASKCNFINSYNIYQRIFYDKFEISKKNFQIFFYIDSSYVILLF